MKKVYERFRDTRKIIWEMTFEGNYEENIKKNWTKLKIFQKWYCNHFPVIPLCSEGYPYPTNITIEIQLIRILWFETVQTCIIFFKILVWKQKKKKKKSWSDFIKKGILKIQDDKTFLQYQKLISLEFGMGHFLLQKFNIPGSSKTIWSTLGVVWYTMVYGPHTIGYSIRAWRLLDLCTNFDCRINFRCRQWWWLFHSFPGCAH